MYCQRLEMFRPRPCKTLLFNIFNNSNINWLCNPADISDFYCLYHNNVCVLYKWIKWIKVFVVGVTNQHQPQATAHFQTTALRHQTLPLEWISFHHKIRMIFSPIFLELLKEVDRCITTYSLSLILLLIRSGNFFFWFKTDYRKLPPSSI